MLEVGFGNLGSEKVERMMRSEKLEQMVMLKRDNAI